MSSLHALMVAIELATRKRDEARQALRERQDQMRQALGASFKPEMINSPEARLSVLNSLIDQQLLMLESSKNRLVVTDGALRLRPGARDVRVARDGKCSARQCRGGWRDALCTRHPSGIRP